MADNGVDISVVIPTYNRIAQLRDVLESMELQSTETDDGEEFAFEVVVVCDGCTDGSQEVLAGLDTGYPLVVVDQENAGPAAARNRGIRQARGSTIVFIDDDVVPVPTCLATHRRHHRGGDDVAVIGPMLEPPDAELTPWVAWEQHQLDKQYAMFERIPVAHYRQFYTGNASVSREALLAAGGFDTTYRRFEDVELAQRLRRNGVEFLFDPDARAHHYAERSYESWFANAHAYGLNTVAFAEAGHSGMLDAVGRELRQRNIVQRFVVHAVLRSPRATRWTLGALHGPISLAHRLGAERTGRHLLSAAYGVNFYRGVAEGLGSTSAFYELVRDEARFDAPVVGFVLEQTLGHVTHSKNLQTFLHTDDRVEPAFLPIAMDDRLSRVPVASNWTVQASVGARRSLRWLRRTLRRLPDALFVHTQVPAVLLGSWMRRIPTVVSLDATPIQYDELGEFYAHRTGPAAVERLKFDLHRRCFGRARHLVVWSSWAKHGLVDRYGVAADDVTVIAPGVDVDMWARPVDGVGERPDTVRILFVGGNLARKGGDVLLEAFRRLRSAPDLGRIELHLVTTSDVADEAGVIVHSGLSPNSPELVALYHSADIFCLPTFGDCLPMVLAEAGAAGLPIVATDVGAIHEIVRDGETGSLVPPGDVDALELALRALVDDGALRSDLGRRARALVERDHDARKNAGRILDVIERHCL